MSLRTSLNADDFQGASTQEQTDSPPAQETASVQPQAPTPPPAEQGGQQTQAPAHEPAIPYERFREVTHENQDLRRQVQEYQQRVQQAQQYDQSHGISGMQAPQQTQLTPTQQQQVDEFRAKLDDPKVAKEWQRRIATEGPNALYDFVEQTILERGNAMLQETLQPIVSEIMALRGDAVDSVVQQYSANIQDPEFPAYRHLFEQSVRNIAPRLGANIRNQQALDTIRFWAQAQYRSQYGQQPQGGLGGLPQQTFQPPLSERPGSPYGLPTQGATDRFTQVDNNLAERFGLSAEDIQAARNRTVRTH